MHKDLGLILNTGNEKLKVQRKRKEGRKEERKEGREEGGKRERKKNEPLLASAFILF
jgi:hypothetical protein